MHPSHQLWYYRGQFWCNACGHTAGVSGRTLQGVCIDKKGRLSAGNAYRCRRLMDGSLPSGIQQWPDEAEGWVRGVEL